MLTEQNLDAMLCTPSASLVRDITQINSDIMILGAGGKMGPSLALLAAAAMRAAGLSHKVYAVSRFTDEGLICQLREAGVEPIVCDLLDTQSLAHLPDVQNIVFMAGKKFGTHGGEALTWTMNVKLPALVAERFQGANIVVFSSGNIYPMTEPCTGGATEAVQPAPIGDYAMSCLGRERMFEHAASAFGTRVLLYRLNYAIDLRYGVLFDIAGKVLAGTPVPLATSCFNCIWQGTANEMALRALLHCESPAAVLNITGPETVSVEYVARRFGALFGKPPVFTGERERVALLSNGGKAHALFGYPAYNVEQLIDMQAEWLMGGGRTLNKPTCFEERDGKF